MLITYLRAMNWLQGRCEKGQTLVEYAMIILLVAILLILALTVLKDTISSTFSRISSSIPSS
ncbi:MAG: Flp family type IVb pilin [Chloroflexi bacterium]|nr:Flp family type IVb pilin [Chloroflexota bacterium]